MVVSESEPVMKSIKAEYKKDGASSVSEIGTKDFIVTATYDDGTTEVLETGYSTSAVDYGSTYSYFLVTIKNNTATVSTTVKVPKK